VVGATADKQEEGTLESEKLNAEGVAEKPESKAPGKDDDDTFNVGETIEFKL
jgi:hypothetical protein